MVNWREAARSGEWAQHFQMLLVSLIIFMESAAEIISKIIQHPKN